MNEKAFAYARAISKLPEASLDTLHVYSDGYVAVVKATSDRHLFLRDHFALACHLFEEGHVGNVSVFVLPMNTDNFPDDLPPMLCLGSGYIDHRMDDAYRIDYALELFGRTGLTNHTN